MQPLHIVDALGRCVAGNRTTEALEALDNDPLDEGMIRVMTSVCGHAHSLEETMADGDITEKHWTDADHGVTVMQEHINTHLQNDSSDQS